MTDALTRSATDLTEPAGGGAPPDLAALVDAAARTYELDRAHVFHSWSAQRQITPMVITAAAGSYIWDGQGRRLLDFSSQLVNTNIGHQHPRVVAAIQEQAGRMCTVAPQHANDQRSEAARLIAEVAPGDRLTKVFFTNAGAEAVEHAARMARLHTGRSKVLAAYRSYHGGTHLAINLTGDSRRWASDTGTSGVVHFFGPFLYRSPFHASSPEEECARALEHLEAVMVAEGPQTLAAIILESIPGSVGVMPPPQGYLTGVRRLCDRYGIVFIADEVMAGFGRTGRWFAVDHDGVVPDLLTFAKGVNSGYVPLGGVLLDESIAETFAERPYPGGLTYSGHPLACAAAVATISAMRDERIVENAAQIGESVLGPGLRALAEKHPSVGDVRGVGVFWALELVRDRATKEPLVPTGATGAANAPMAELTKACKDAGLLPFVAANRVHVVPPCTVSAEEAREGLALLDEALAVADAHMA